MKQPSTNTVKCARNAEGALAPMNQNNAAATPNVIPALVPEAGPLLCPWPPLALAAGAAAAGLATAGTAGSFGAGGGQVTSPFLMTVRPRMASSSMLTSMMPSLVLHSSSERRNRLVPYRVDDCLARREFRSV